MITDVEILLKDQDVTVFQDSGLHDVWLIFHPLLKLLRLELAIPKLQVLFKIGDLYKILLIERQRLL